jgi:L,D-peptidoglycan transpeptidase YkuD (ErfK/YbiS/YcfS/YnhG family)
MTSMRGITAGATLLVALAAAPAAPAKTPAVDPDGIRGLDGASQVIVVAASGMRTTHATARTYERIGGGWQIKRRAMPARVGVNGLSRPTRRHSGDGTTPIGNYGFVYGFGSRDDPGVTGFSWRSLGPGDCWAGTPRKYNRWVHRTPCDPADENLWSHARVAYRYAAVIDFNYRKPVYGRGSGIFLHVQTGGPTLGCVSLREADLVPVLRWMRPGARILIGPTSWLRSLAKPLPATAAREASSAPRRRPSASG